MCNMAIALTAPAREAVYREFNGRVVTADEKLRLPFNCGQAACIVQTGAVGNGIGWDQAPHKAKLDRTERQLRVVAFTPSFFSNQVLFKLVLP